MNFRMKLNLLRHEVGVYNQLWSWLFTEEYQPCYQLPQKQSTLHFLFFNVNAHYCCSSWTVLNSAIEIYSSHLRSLFTFKNLSQFSLVRHPAKACKMTFHRWSSTASNNKLLANIALPSIRINFHKILSLPGRQFS